jgi:hypothetical protein
VAAVLLLALPARADDTLQTMQAEFEAAQKQWYEQVEAIYQKAQEEGRMFDMTSVPPSPREAFLPRFRSYAEKHAGTDHAVPALVWIVSNPPNGPGMPDFEPTQWAVDELRRHHAASPDIAEALQALLYSPPGVADRIVALCETVLEENGNADCRSSAKFVLAITLYGNLFEGPGRDPERAKQLFRQLAESADSNPYADQAKGYLYEAEHLQVGMKAPAIEGTSVEGTPIRLAQFEGQVVVLDFWGFW